MANRKLAQDAQPLDELAAQTYDLRTVPGKNIQRWLDYADRHNWTTDKAFIRNYVSTLQRKGVAGHDGHVDVTIGAKVKGAKLPHPVPGKYVHERVGTSRASGKELVRAFPVSYTLSDAQGTITVRAGYINNTRLASEDLLGPDHVNLAIAFLPRLDSQDFPRLLEERVTHDKEARERKVREHLENPLARMPADYRTMLEQRGIAVEALNSIDVLEAGEHLANERWSAVLYLIDPGKKRNLYHWFEAKFAKDEMPADVKDAWVFLHEFPHHEDVGKKLQLLGNYQFQEKPERRKGLANGMPEELRWLATSQKKDAKDARKRYGREIDLDEDHTPVLFYDGAVSKGTMTIRKLLQEPYWTVADREGVLRKFPMEEFRMDWNREAVYKRFGSAKGFAHTMEALATAIGKELIPETELPFVRHMFSRMGLGEQKGVYKLENLLRRTPITEARRDYDKLQVLAKLYAP